MAPLTTGGHPPLADVRSFAEGAAAVWIRRGHAQAEEDCEAALDCFERALSLRPEDPDILHLAGRELLHLGRAEEAEDRLREAWERGRQGEYADSLARLYTRHIERPEAARALLDSVEEQIEENGEDLGLRIARGELLGCLDEFQQSRAEFEAVLAVHADHQEARDGLAVTCNREAFRCYDEGETEKAIFLLKQAMDVTPEWVGLHVNLGRMFMELDRLDRAREEFGYAVEGDPDDPIAWFNLGHLERESGDLEAAAEALSRVLELDESYPDARPELAGVVHDLGYHERAIELLVAELDVHPECAVCAHNLGLAYLEDGDLGRAESRLRQAVVADSAYFRGHYTLANVLVRLGELDEGLEMLTRAAALDPQLLGEWLQEDREEFSPLEDDPQFLALFTD